MIDKKVLSQYGSNGTCLKDKIILITGAGRGIGKEAALTFARHGATVILLGRTLQNLEAVYDQIEAEKLPRPAIFPINLESATEHDYQAMFESIDEELGKLDGLLHNASELGPRTPIEQYSPAQWQKVMQVNVTAPFMLTKHLMPLLDKADNASIMFTGSSVGLKGRAYWGAYAISKAACENLMQTLADEIGETKKVRANSINPGATRTDMRAKAYPAEDPSSVKQADAMMPLYIYLMSDDSLEINGQQINANDYFTQ